MSFWKKLFGKSEHKRESGGSEGKEAKGSIDERRIACIVLSIGSPSLRVAADDAARLYEQINPAWSGRHQIHVSCMPSEIHPDGEGLSKVIDHALGLDFVSRLAEAGCTAFVQDCNLASQPGSRRIPAAFCTFVPSNQKQILLLGSQTPIPMHSTAFDPKDPSLSSGLPFSKLKHIFLFTDRDGASVSSSQAVISVIESVTGQPMEAINVRVPTSLVHHSAVGSLLAKDGRFPNIGIAEIEKRQPQLAMEIRQGTLTLCCRPVKAPDSGEQVGVVAIYSALETISYEGGPVELFYERMSRDLVSRHGALVNVDYVSHFPKFEIWVCYEDGTRLYSGQRTGHYDIHFMSFGYVGEGPRYAQHFLAAAGFELTIDDIESIRPGDSIQKKDGRTIIVRKDEKVTEDDSNPVKF